MPGRVPRPGAFDAAIDMTMNEVKTDDAPYILGAWLTTEHAGGAAWEAHP